MSQSCYIPMPRSDNYRWTNPCISTTRSLAHRACRQRGRPHPRAGTTASCTSSRSPCSQTEPPVIRRCECWWDRPCRGRKTRPASRSGTCRSACRWWPAPGTHRPTSTRWGMLPRSQSCPPGRPPRPWRRTWPQRLGEGGGGGGGRGELRREQRSDCGGVSGSVSPFLKGLGDDGGVGGWRVERVLGSDRWGV